MGVKSTFRWLAVTAAEGAPGCLLSWGDCHVSASCLVQDQQVGAEAASSPGSVQGGVRPWHPFLGWLGRADVEDGMEGGSGCRLPFWASPGQAEVTQPREKEGTWGGVEGPTAPGLFLLTQVPMEGWS